MILRPIKKISRAIFDQPLLYRGIRSLFLGGLPTSPLLALLQADENDVLLDIGCGTGFIAEKTVYREYWGFDSDPKVIEIAKKKNIPHAHFEVASSESFDYQKVRPTKAVLYGILHHLDNQTARSLLKILASCVTKNIVTLDSVYSRYHWFNNLLCLLDRGDFVRTEKGWDDLIRDAGLKQDQRLIHYANTKIAKYLLYRLMPFSDGSNKEVSF